MEKNDEERNEVQMRLETQRGLRKYTTNRKKRGFECKNFKESSEFVPVWCSTARESRRGPSYMMPELKIYIF